MNGHNTKGVIGRFSQKNITTQNVLIEVVNMLFKNPLQNVDFKRIIENILTVFACSL